MMDMIVIIGTGIAVAVMGYGATEILATQIAVALGIEAITASAVWWRRRKVPQG